MFKLNPSQLTSRAIYAITLILGGAGILPQNAMAQLPQLHTQVEQAEQNQQPVSQNHQGHQTPDEDVVAKTLSYEGFYTGSKQPVYMSIRGPLRGRKFSYMVFLAKTGGERNDQIRSVEIFLMDPAKPASRGSRQGAEGVNVGTYQLIRIGQKSDGEIGHEEADPSYILNAKAAYPFRSQGVQGLNIFKNCTDFKEMSFDLVGPRRGTGSDAIVFKGTCSEKAIMGYKAGDYFSPDSKPLGIRITASPLDNEGEAQITFPAVAGLNGSYTVREKLDSIYTLRQESYDGTGYEIESRDRKIVLFAKDLDWLCKFLPKGIPIPGSTRKFGLCQTGDVMMLINPKNKWQLELLSYARFQ